MKNPLLVWLVVGLVPLLASCASSGGSLVLGPVGPETSKRIELAPTGYLKVYSATEDHNDGDVHYFPHTSYTIYSAEGKIVKKVANAIGIHDEDPALAEIPAGTYTVLAESEYYGMVKVKVVIEPGKLTTVNLRHNEPSQRDPSKRNNDLVRLPNGSVVGWRAEGSPQANAVGAAQVK
jgi:IS5 family transposase